MKLIIAGSRWITDPLLLTHALEQSRIKPVDVTEVVSGGAAGVDSLGERWAADRAIPVKRFPVTKILFGAFGKVVPLQRNKAMVLYGDVLLAVWDGASKGTMNMINEMNDLGKPTFVARVSLLGEKLN